MKKALLPILLLFVLTSLAFSHGGGLDANGGQYMA